MSSASQKQLPKFKRITAPQYTPVPDYFLDEALSKLKSAAQIQIYLFICRHTFGWKKNAEDLSLNFIAQGLGLKRNTVVKVTSALIKMNLIVRRTNQDDKGSNLASTYALNMEGSPVKLPPQKTPQEEDLLLGDQNHLGGRGLQSPSPRGLQSPKTNTDVFKNNNKGDVAADLLVQKGVGKGVARRLASEYEADYIEQKISYLEWKLEHEYGSIQKPAAWLRRAIEDDYSPPDKYKTADEIAAEKEQEIAAQKAQEARRKQEEQEQRKKLEREEKARQEALGKLRRQQKKGVMTDNDLAVWAKAKDSLKVNGYSPLTIAAMELLGLDRDAGKLTVGIANPVAYKNLLQPAVQAELKRDLGSVLGIQNVTLEFLQIRLDPLQASEPKRIQRYRPKSADATFAP